MADSFKTRGSSTDKSKSVLQTNREKKRAVDGPSDSIIASADVQNTTQEISTPEPVNRYLKQVFRSQLIGELFSEIVHDIRQPLGAISNFAFAVRNTLLSDSPNLEKVVEWINDIDANIQRANQTIQQLREFVQNAHPTRKETDINASVHDAIQILKFRFKRMDINIQLDLSEQTPIAAIRPDEWLLVVLRVLWNASPLLPSDEVVTQSLRIRTGVVNDQVFVEISSQRQGQSLQQQDTDQTISTGSDNKPGVEFAISQDIIREYGGQIRVSSNDAEHTIMILVPQWSP